MTALWVISELCQTCSELCNIHKNMVWPPVIRSVIQSFQIIRLSEVFPPFQEICRVKIKTVTFRFIATFSEKFLSYIKLSLVPVQESRIVLCFPAGLLLVGPCSISAYSSLYGNTSLSSALRARSRYICDFRESFCLKAGRMTDSLPEDFPGTAPLQKLPHSKDLHSYTIKPVQ